MLRTKPAHTTTEEFVDMLKSRPDHMFVTTSYIAVWHSGLNTAIMIPGKFQDVNDNQANVILQANLERITTM